MCYALPGDPKNKHHRSKKDIYRTSISFWLIYIFKKKEKSIFVIFSLYFLTLFFPSSYLWLVCDMAQKKVLYPFLWVFVCFILACFVFHHTELDISLAQLDHTTIPLNPSCFLFCIPAILSNWLIPNMYFLFQQPWCVV